MNRKTRLIVMLSSLLVLVIIGRFVTGSFGFIIGQFWFTSGLFLLILLALIDQPHFSKDANIFVNGATAWISLLLVDSAKRGGIWWLFFIWASYLIICSYILMWVRSRQLGEESRTIQGFSRTNRQIGRPEAIFSAFFLWGCIQQFGMQTGQLSALFLFWAVFMIINIPSVSEIISKLMEKSSSKSIQPHGRLLRLVSPGIAEAKIPAEWPRVIAGRFACISTSEGTIAARVRILDDRVIAGLRIARLAIISNDQAWTEIGSEAELNVIIEDTSQEKTPLSPVSVVDTGSEIDKIVFNVNPDTTFQTGEVLWVQINRETKAFYQVIAGEVIQIPSTEGNAVQSVRVTAGQLGIWNNKFCRFEPITWVAPAGQLIYRAKSLDEKSDHVLPSGHEIVGTVPNSDFPIHVNIPDIVTHNTAIIGVTGSGKSYLAFHLIEAMIKEGIKVLILDLSRQHWLFLKQCNPTALKTEVEVSTWLKDSKSLVAINQFALATDGSYPMATVKFAEAAYKELSSTQLKAGVNEPARLCIVLEEAHSLIPEWNQVAQQSDVQWVNRTARAILQGRKYGMGTLVITQRTANVTKTILNQCNTIFALQSFDQTGLDFLKNYMGEKYAHSISTLPAQTAILVGKASSSTRPIIFCIPDFKDRWKESDKQTVQPTSKS